MTIYRLFSSLTSSYITPKLLYSQQVNVGRALEVWFYKKLPLSSKSQTPTQSTQTLHRIKPCVATTMALCLHSGACVNSCWVPAVELGSTAGNHPAFLGSSLWERQGNQPGILDTVPGLKVHSICIYFLWPDQPFSTNTWAFFVESCQNPPPSVYLSSNPSLPFFCL